MFYWFNDFNQVEQGGPFESAEDAKQDAAETYTEIQDGMAISILVKDLEGQIIADGHIAGGKWGEGVHPKWRHLEESTDD